MPAPLRRLTVAQFQLLMDPALLTRTIDAVHVHHTWKPERADFRGEATIEAMRRYHLSLGWDDIAQHATIDPAGGIWTGRNWNLAPASSSGHNGSRTKGPFMFEMVGNFDEGHDPFDGDQRATAVAVTAHILRVSGLTTDAVHFHRELNNNKKTCPGSGIDRKAFIADVAAAMAAAAAPRRAKAAPAAPLFAPKFLVGFGVTTPATPVVDLSRATVPEHAAGSAEVERTARAGVAAAQRGIRYARDLSGLAASPATRGNDWSMLKPHVVNLTRGELSDGGEFETTPQDLDGIISAIRDRAASQPSLKVMIHAHGGLVKEPDALAYAKAMYQWWLTKDVYPVYFVWETGLFEQITQALSARRDVTSLTDAVLEELARPLGRVAWNSMKTSALLSSSTDTGHGVAGGARLFARKLALFLTEAVAAQVSVHLVGHSAGAIFHSHFVPALIAEGTPRVASLSLLAPAVRTDLFTQAIVPLVEHGTLAHHLFTMEDEAERDDNVALVYRKSLLYLVSEAFEPHRKQPLVGLQRALKKDARLRALYGLDAEGFPTGDPAPAELQYSMAEGKPENPLTRSRTHGGFDNDVKTMSSVLRRILGVPDSTHLGEADFPPEATRAIEALRASAATATATGPAIVVPAAGGGRQLALCIGIDRYRDRPLQGCVNDARRWGHVLGEVGFDVQFLLDEQATQRGIGDAIRALIGRARPGDVLALQYAGHGTQLPDDSGDEADGFDEALVPIDYHTGALFLRDDLVAEALAGLPAGAALTLFMDCCHCGSNSRFAPAMRAAESATDRVRYLPMSDEILRSARAMRRARGARPLAAVSAPGVIHLAACQDDEFAWESGGQGDFTAAATAELKAALARGDTNEAYLDVIRRPIAARGRQHPLMMPPAAGMAGRRLLAPLGAAAAAAASAASSGPAATDGDRELLQHLQAAVSLLQRRLG